MTYYGGDYFRGRAHDYRSLGDSCHLWTPTAKYLAWLDLQYPRMSDDEMIRRKWKKPPRR